MTIISRIVLSAPFILALIDYLQFGAVVLANETVDAFWQNHAMRETIYAVVISGVILNFIWSTITPMKMMMIAVFGAPFVLSFWIADFAVGHGDAPIAQESFANHLVQILLFAVGYAMALSTKPQKPPPA